MSDAKICQTDKIV